MAARTLTTPQLRLAPVSEADTDALHAILIDADVRRYLCDGRIVPREFAVDLVRDSSKWFRLHSVGLWLLHESPAPRAIGFCMLRPPGEHPAPELLYALLPNSWGRGYAVEASRAVLAHAFEVLGCAEVIAEMDEPNSASVHVAEKLGMRFIGTRPGPAHTLLRYAVTREQFAAVTAR